MIVFDKSRFGSNREIDSVNGYLRVEDCNITKVQVRNYLGREIPCWQDFGLESDKIYNVFCPAEELEKAVNSFDNIPLTRDHIAIEVDNVPKERIVGSLGDHARFEYPYLKNNLIVYDKKDIDNIINGKRKELSCGYRYTPVRESGVFEGQRYDFKMTNIIGNHVAIVKKGRAGSDVMVADSSKNLLEVIKEKVMAVFDKDLVGDEFKESEHPRDKSGRFTSASGEGSGSEKKESVSLKNDIDVKNYWQKTGSEKSRKEGLIKVENAELNDLENLYSEAKEKNDSYRIKNLEKAIASTKEHISKLKSEIAEIDDKEKKSDTGSEKKDVGSEKSSVKSMYEKEKDNYLKSKEFEEFKKVNGSQARASASLDYRKKRMTDWADYDIKDTLEDFQKDLDEFQNGDFTDYDKEHVKNLAKEVAQFEFLSKMAQKTTEDAKLDKAEQEKVGVVMKEFKEGELKSGSGEKVIDPKQAMAIALSEADDLTEDKASDKIDDKEVLDSQESEEKGEKEMTEEVKEEKVEELKAEEKLAEDEKPEEEKSLEEKKEEITEEKQVCEEPMVEDEPKEEKEEMPAEEEKEEKSEKKKKDEEPASEEEPTEDACGKKEMAKDSALVMDADAIRAEGREQGIKEAMEDYKAREVARKAVRKMVGDVDVFAFDSADEIYKFACEKSGMDLEGIVSFKDAFRGLQSSRVKLTLDASPISGSNEECLADIRIA